MPYVQFTTRHYIDDHLYEAGERAWLGDHVALSAGMIDLGAEAKAAAPTSAEQKAGMNQVLAERKAADEAAANEIAMELAVERAKVEAAAAEAKAADAAAAKEQAATNATLQPAVDPNEPAFVDHRKDEPGPQGAGTIQTKA